MRSTAQIKGHPIHPALIPFPFAFLFGAAIFDFVGAASAWSSLSLTAAHLTLAGIAAGLLAAIPGAVDYFYTVPPASSGRTRATKHAVGNVVTLVLFAFAWLLRRQDWSSTPLTLAFEAAGAIALAYSGWLGGTLVTRNLISVDHRYAGAGKWQDVSVASNGDAIDVGHKDDLEEDQMKLLRINGRRVVLARTADGYTAFDDRCTHRGGSLAGGVMIGGTVQCLWHGSQFDSDTGEVACGPAKKKIAVYEVRTQRNGRLMLVSPPK